jgi:hypothetical protein
MIRTESELAIVEEHILGCERCARRAELSAAYVDTLRATLAIQEYPLAPNSHQQNIPIAGAQESIIGLASGCMGDPAHLWQRVLAAGQRLLEAQAEESKLHGAYSENRSNEALWHWRAARIEVDRLAQTYEAEMRLFRIASRDDAE